MNRVGSLRNFRLILNEATELAVSNTVPSERQDEYMSLAGLNQVIPFDIDGLKESILESLNLINYDFPTDAKSIVIKPKHARSLEKPSQRVYWIILRMC